MSFLFHTSGSVGDLGGQPPRSTRPKEIPQRDSKVQTDNASLIFFRQRIG